MTQRAESRPLTEDEKIDNHVETELIRAYELNWLNFKSFTLRKAAIGIQSARDSR